MKKDYHNNKQAELRDKYRHAGRAWRGEPDHPANHASAEELDSLHHDIHRYSHVLGIHPDHVKEIRAKIDAYKSKAKSDKRKEDLHRKAAWKASSLIDRANATNHPLHHALIKAGFKHTGPAKNYSSSHSYEAPADMTMNKITRLAKEHGLEGKRHTEKGRKAGWSKTLRKEMPAKADTYYTAYHGGEYKTSWGSTSHLHTLHVDHGEDPKAIKSIRFTSHVPESE